MTARFSQVASVLSSGVLTRQAPTPASASFPMAEVAGEWRIAAAPAGLLLSERQLERAFEVRNVYYLNPPRSSAVPDVRMLPRTDAEALATALLSALLAGPSQWLAAGVVSAIPEGMQLALGAVPVADGVAQIDLQGPGVGDAVGREQLGAQLAWTLQQVPGLTAMAVTLDGRPLPLLEGRGPVPLTAFERFDPDVLIAAPPLYGVTPQGSFAVATEGDAEPLPVAEGAAALPAVGSAAAAPRSGLVAGAAADGSGLVLLVPGRPAPRLVEAAISAGPNIDGLDRVWWADPEGRVLQTEVRDDSPVAQVELAGPIGPVRVVRPSRDGTRVAVLAGDGPQRQLLVGVIVAGSRGRQVQGLQPLRAAGELLDVAWRSADELSVLSSGPQLLQRLDLLGSVGASLAVPETAATLRRRARRRRSAGTVRRHRRPPYRRWRAPGRRPLRSGLPRLRRSGVFPQRPGVPRRRLPGTAGSAPAGILLPCPTRSCARSAGCCGR